MATEQETEDKDETISSTLTQDFDREKVEREFINLTSHYQQIGESFRNLVKEVPHMRKHQLTTHLADMPILPMIKVTTEEKVSSMYGQLIGTVYPNIPLSSASLHGHPQSSLGATLGVRMSATAYGNLSTMSCVWPIGTSRLNLRPRPLSI